MIGLLLAVLLGTGAQAGAAGLTVSHRARAVAAGEVVLVDVKAGAPLESVEAVWLGRIVRFYPLDGSHWQGLAPIDVSARAGRYTLNVSAVATDGRVLTRAYAIVIAARTFPVRRISVEERFVDPPQDELARIERERKTVEAIFASPPGERRWSQPFVVPVPGKSTSSFGRRTIVNGEPRSPHTGADFQAATGTVVVAPNRGLVALADDSVLSWTHGHRRSRGGRVLVPRAPVGDPCRERRDGRAGSDARSVGRDRPRHRSAPSLDAPPRGGESRSAVAVVRARRRTRARRGRAALRALFRTRSVRLSRTGTGPPEGGHYSMLKCSSVAALWRTGEARRGHGARLARRAGRTSGTRDLHVRRAAVGRELQSARFHAPRERLDARRALVLRVVERHDQISADREPASACSARATLP